MKRENDVRIMNVLERPCIQKNVKLINVPFGLGGKREGAELGPEAMMQAGLLRQLKRIGVDNIGVDQVDCSQKAKHSNEGKPVKYVSEVKEMTVKVADCVSRAVSENAFPLILGGDHSIAMGSIAGLTAHYSKLGIIWFDAHPDLNTEKTTPSGNMHGMSLAAALGQTEFQLSDIPGSNIPIDKKNIVMIGTRDIDDGEKELIRSEGITCFTMHEIDRMGILNVVKKALDVAGEGTDGIHLSFDIDSLDPLEAPGVATPVPGGVSYREAHFALELMAESRSITSMDMVEVNPLLDHNRRTARLAVELIASLLGKRIL